MLRGTNWPGAAVIAVLVAGGLAALFWGPQDMLREIIGGEIVAILVAYWIDKRRPARTDPPSEGEE